MDYYYPLETKLVVGVIEGGRFFYPTVVTPFSNTTAIPQPTRAKAQLKLFKLLRRYFSLTLQEIRGL